jgi:hypothetical protein
LRTTSPGAPFLSLRLDTKEPMELGAFVGAFTSLANEFERYIKRSYPDVSVEEAELFVRKVRRGSVIVELLPWVAVAAPFISDMEKALVVDKFVRIWAARFQALFTRKEHKETPNTRAELKDWSDAVAAIARDPDGSATLEAAVFQDGKKKIKAAFKFNTHQARAAQKVIEVRQRQLERKEHADHSRVLMRFTRSDIGDVNVGKPSGERIVIEDISDKPLALIYASEIAEDRIKHEIREADENAFKKGFVVDVNVRSIGGRPVAYAVTNVHQIIDLPN